MSVRNPTNSSVKFGVVLFIVSLILTEFFIKTITPETNIILPMWILFLDLIFILIKKVTTLRDPNVILGLTSFTSLVITSIITFFVLEYNILQYVEYFTFWSSIFVVLHTYTKVFTEHN